MPEKTSQEFITAILDADYQLAMKILDAWRLHFGTENTINNLLIPSLTKIGEIWNKDPHAISLAQGYVAGKIASDFMLKAFANAEEINKNDDTPTNIRKGPVIIGNIEDDHHSLGRKVVAIFLKCKGWEVYDLGNDVLSEDFITKAIEVNAKVIAVSAMMYSTAVNIKKLRQRINSCSELSGKVKLAVGGAVFILRPELVQEVGGDITASNAFLVPDLFDRLLVQTEGATNEFT